MTLSSTESSTSPGMKKKKTRATGERYNGKVLLHRTKRKCEHAQPHPRVVHKFPDLADVGSDGFEAIVCLGAVSHPGDFI